MSPACRSVIKVLLILLKNTSFCKAFREKSLFFKEKSYPTKELPLQVQLGTAVLLVSLLFELEFNYVNSAKLLAVLRILLCVESNLLALFKSLEAVAYDCGKVYEYVVAAIIVGDESVAFLRIEPLNCTVIHFGTSINKIFRTALNKSPYISVGLYSRKLTCICNSFNVQMTYKIACEFNNASELL